MCNIDYTSSSFLDCTRGLKLEDPKPSDELKDKNEIRVLFLGMRKVGKTSSIMTLLGKHLDCRTLQSPVHELSRSELNLKLVEAPGFGENEEEIETAISTSLSFCDPGPHVIIIVLSLDRFTPAAKKTMKIVQEKLGDDSRSHTMILFTGEKNLESKSIQTFIMKNPDLSKVVEQAYNHFYAFNNTSSQTQIEELLQMIDDMYQNNEGFFYRSTTDKLMNRSRAEMSSEVQSKLINDPVQVVLIGASGSGKSSSGNTILGKRVFRSELSRRSVTRCCQTEAGRVNGREVTVVDTPGWDCTDLSQNEISSQIKEALRNLQGPYSFLLVLHVGRVESMKIKAIYDLQKLLGPSFLDQTTILFTHSDDLQFKTFEEFLNEGRPEFQELLKKCGQRRHCWNNRDPRPDEVKKLLQDLKNTEMDKPRSAKNPRNEIQEMDCTPSSLSNSEHGMHLNNPKTTQTHLTKKYIRVLFLGMRKVGKTSSIMTLLGKHLDCRTLQTPVHELSRSELNLKLVEAPGFGDNEEEIETAISTSLSLCDPGPHVIIIVLSLDHFSTAAKKTMKIINKQLGDKTRSHTMILFTGEDNLEGKSIQTFIKENPDLIKVVEKYENSFHAFNNRETSNQTQVEELIHKINDLYQKNRGEFYTNAASVQPVCKGVEAWRLILLGKTGVGKSAVGNTILGEKVFKSELGSSSVTTECTIKVKKMNNKIITVMDTPGLFNTNVSNDEIRKQIVKGLQLIAPGPHAFILVINTSRFTQEEIDIVKYIQEIFGEKVYKYMIVLVTQGDHLEHVNKTIETFIKETGPHLQDLVSSCGGRCHLFNNERLDDRAQVDVLLEKIYKMLKGNNHEFYSYIHFKIAQLLKSSSNESCNIM